jgi:Tfp pilus assembly protein PilX
MSMKCMYRSKKNEDGFASIVIALILIIVLALLTTGFAQLARREQQNSIDKELANQAYYAAETGINDLYNAIFVSKTINNTTLYTNPVSYTNNTCLTTNQYQQLGLPPASIDSNTNTSVTCAMVNLTPNNLSWNLTPSQPETLVFQSMSGPNTPAAISSMTISWDSADGHTTYPNSTTNGNFLPDSGINSWNPSTSSQPANSRPVLGISITPMGNGTGLTRDDLIGSTYYAYLYPAAAESCPAPPNIALSSSCNYTTVIGNQSLQAAILDGGCGVGYSPYSCNVTIRGLPNTANDTWYLIHLFDYYDDATVTNTATLASGSPTPADFSGQAVIDVTGKTQNVLKRVQVVASNSPSASGYAIEGSVCKRQQTWPGTTNYIDLSGNNDNDNHDPVCNLSN